MAALFTKMSHLMVLTGLTRLTLVICKFCFILF
uniref:Uncharacterized protein n=1 Tax=Anguilla anguilla TaxID=7936 RepID=A0A0E9TT51_ANGAN